MRKPKNPKDPRLLKTDQKIISSLNRLLISRASIANRPADIYRRAAVGRSTFFDHFRTPDQALRAEEASILKEFKRRLTANLPPDASPKTTFIFITVFIMQHRDFFRATARLNNYRTFEKLLALARSRLTATWPRLAPATARHLFLLYTMNLEITFRAWAAKRLTAQEADAIINRFNRSAAAFSRHLPTLATLVPPAPKNQPPKNQPTTAKTPKIKPKTPKTTKKEPK